MLFPSSDILIGKFGVVDWIRLSQILSGSNFGDLNENVYLFLFSTNVPLTSFLVSSFESSLMVSA